MPFVRGGESLGNYTPAQQKLVDAWRADVKRRGGIATMMPTVINGVAQVGGGMPAGKFTVAGKVKYESAPLDVLRAYGASQYVLAEAQRKGAAPSILQRVTTTAGKAATAVARVSPITLPIRAAAATVRAVVAPAKPAATSATSAPSSVLSRLSTLTAKIAGVGTTSAPAADARALWAAEVQRRGGMVTVHPSILGGVRQGAGGLPAARYPAPGGGYVYELAPVGVITAHEKARAAEADAIIRGERAEAMWNDVKTGTAGVAGAVRGAVTTVAEIPRDVLSHVTGIPKWVFPAALIGAGALVIHNLTARGGPVMSAVQRALPRRNPRGRRRRGARG